MRSKDPPYMSPLLKLLIKKRSRLLHQRRTVEAEALNTRIKSLMSENMKTKIAKKGTKQWWSQVNRFCGKVQENDIYDDINLDRVNERFTNER